MTTTRGSDNSNRNDNSNNNDSLKFVRLNEFEDGAIKNGSNATATITWCSGNHETVAALLWKERLCEIVKVNPWLAGRIVQRGHNFLEYKPQGITTEEMEPLFRHWTVDEAFLSPQTPYEDLGCKCANAGLVPPFAFDATKPLFQVSVMPSCSKGEGTPSACTFAIIVTMSHVVGDGDTYYAIYHMLMSGSSIKALDVERVDLQLLQQHEALGKQECGLLHSGGFIWTAIRGVLAAKVLGLFSQKYRWTTRTLLVDMDKLKALKDKDDEGDKKVAFVSTNDIITSWYLRNSACQHGMMAINLRGRLDNYNNDKAGNYENLLYYHIPEDCQTPSLIRRSLSPLKRVVTTDRAPTTGELATGNFAIISSWASFQGAPFQLGGGCQQLAHLPIYNVKGAPTTISMGIIFRYSPTKLAVLVSGTPRQLEGLKDAPFASLEETIDCHF